MELTGGGAGLAATGLLGTTAERTTSPITRELNVHTVMCFVSVEIGLPVFLDGHSVCVDSFIILFSIFSTQCNFASVQVGLHVCYLS